MKLSGKLGGTELGKQWCVLGKIASPSAMVCFRMVCSENGNVLREEGTLFFQGLSLPEIRRF